MKDIIAFYKTPTGQKTLDVMPQLQQQAMQLGTTRVQRYLPELQQEIKKIRLGLPQKQ